MSNASRADRPSGFALWSCAHHDNFLIMRPHRLMARSLAAAPITTALASPAAAASPDTSTQTDEVMAVLHVVQPGRLMHLKAH